MLLCVLAFPGFWFIWRILGRILRQHLITKTTALDELVELGARRTSGKIRGTVVICGGSIAGLLAARVCADHFDDVVVVDPEAWLAGDDGTKSLYDEAGNPCFTSKWKRSRVFQYDAVHAFQVFATSALQKLFANWDDEAKKSDIRIMSYTLAAAVSGVLVESPVEYYPFTGLPSCHFCSREAFEILLRRLTKETCPNIRWIVGTVTGIHAASEDRRRIASVSIRVGQSGSEISETTTLLVDCTGASQAGVKWLERAGYGAQTSTVKDSLTLQNFRISYDAKMRYRDFVVFVKPERRSQLPVPMGYDRAGLMYAYLPDSAIEHKNLVLTRLEGHRILVGTGGWGVDESELPMTCAEVKKYLRSFIGIKPVEQWVIETIEVLLEDAGFSESDEIPCLDRKIPSCTYLQYHRVLDLPSNFIALGDSVMKVNPIFGQGCTKACIGALTLNSVVLKTQLDSASEKDVLPPDFGRKFWSTQAPKIEPIWNGTKIPDYGFRSTIPVEGEELSKDALLRWYGERFLKARSTDREINHVFFLTRHFLAPITDIFHPKIVAKIIWQSLTKP